MSRRDGPWAWRRGRSRPLLWACLITVQAGCRPAPPALPEVRAQDRTLAVGPPLAQLLARHHRQGRRAPYGPAGQANRAGLRQWVSRTLGGGCGAARVPRGFALLRPAGRPELQLLVERPAPRGRGFYLLRCGSRAPYLVQVPHAYHDRHTLPLGLTVFDTLAGALLMVNSVHRHAACRGVARRPDEPPSGEAASPARAGGGRKRRCRSDVAHAADSAYHAAHLGAIQALAGASVIALHGFARRGDDPDIILSAAGTAAPTSAVATAVAAAFPSWRVGQYPRDTQRLGGVTGVQAKDLRQRRSRMLHIELARPVREALRRDARLRRRFARALAAFGERR